MVKYTTRQNILYLIKNLWKWNKILFFLALIQVPITVIVPLLQIYLPKVVIDSVTKKLDVNRLMLSIFVPLLIIILLNLSMSIAGSLSSFMAVSYRAKYGELIVEKTIDTDYENIDGVKGQEMIAKAMTAMESNDSSTEAIIAVSIALLSNIIGFFLYASIIFTIHPAIVIFLILSSILNYVVGRHVSKFEHKNKDNIAPLEMKLRYIANKTGDFKTAKDIRLYNMFPWFKKVYNITKKQKVKFEINNLKRRYFGNFVDGLLILIRDGITYGFLIYSVLYKEMTIGNFVLYFGAVTGFSTWLSGIVKNLTDLNSISLAVNDLRAYLEMEDKANRGEGVELPTDFELPCDIELIGVYYKYPGAEEYTIKNMNIKINKGEKIALVGVNGAGKTTLVKLICGLYTPTTGKILINGKDSRLYNRDEYFTLFSVVFQETHILPLSIEKNIALKTEEKIDNEKIDEVLKMSGLYKKVETLTSGKETLLMKAIHENAIELSGGEMQKLMLSRALYKDSPIIILDEPTAALDPIAENEIYQRYGAFTKGHTSIFISHRLSSTRFCNRILFIENGSIKEEGSHEELMEKGGKYNEMYEMQSYYYKEDLGGEKYA